MRTLVAAVLLGVVITTSQLRIDQILPPAPESERLAVWSGPVSRALSFGFADLWSDITWLRAVQYAGSQRKFADNKTFKNLRPLLNLTTDLDPRYDVAYRYGAFFLAESPPLGPGDLAGSLALLRKGLVAMPDNWQLLQWSAFCRSFYGGDSAGAADDALLASKIPGAPSFMGALAAAYRRASGDLDAAEVLFRQMIQNPEEYLQTSGKRGLEQVASLRQARVVEEALRRWTKQKGAPPDQLTQLAEMVPGIGLADTRGTPFDYAPASGKVTISRRSPIWSPALTH